MVFRDVTFDEAVRLYMSYCKARGLARRTLSTYADALDQLRRTLDVSESSCPLPTRHDLRAFTAQLPQDGYARTTISIRMRAVRAFGAFLEKEGIAADSPMRGVEIPRVPSAMPEVLSAAEMQCLLKAARTGTWFGVRNHAIIAMFCDTGLRLGELIDLDLKDVDISALSIQVRCGKGSKQRRVHVGRALARSLRKWVAVHPLLAENTACFCTRDGRRLDKRNVGRIVERLAARAGLADRRVHPHLLRHTFATHFIKNGGDPFSLQRLLGHSDIKTTMIYVNLAGVDLEEAHAKASPLDRLTS